MNDLEINFLRKDQSTLGIGIIGNVFWGKGSQNEYF